MALFLFQEEQTDNKGPGGILQTEVKAESEVLNGKNGEKTGGSTKGRTHWPMMAYGGRLPCQGLVEGEAQQEKVLGYNTV